MSDKPEITAIVPRTLPETLQLAGELAKAKPVLPRHVTDAPTAAAILLAGAELGLPPMLALRSISMVEGKPVIAADIQLALLVRAGLKFRWAKSDDTVAELELDRAGQPKHVQRYTIQQAQNAGLAGKDNWRKHPAAMLRARCVTAAVRAYAPDVLAGILSPDEADEVRGGDSAPPVIDVAAEPVTEAPAPRPANDVFVRLKNKIRKVEDKLDNELQIETLRLETGIGPNLDDASEEHLRAYGRALEAALAEAAAAAPEAK